MLTGTVLDKSPAQPGTTAVSDDSMTTWMNYLMQNNASLVNSPPKPNGVPVTLTALDPNGNTESIGTVITDASGHYALSWTPPVVGLYAITASFKGTNSYWSSSEETSINVIESSATTTATAIPTQSITNQYFIPAVIGIVITIVLVGAVLAILLLRKHQ